MSMDPTKWVPFDKLSESTRERVETVYPYLKLEQCLFQDKMSGVFMKAINNVKIEKLLDPVGAGPKPGPPAPPTTTRRATSGSGRTKK